MSEIKYSKTIDLDISDLIGEGDLSKIIDALSYYKSLGYEKLYWDGYDSWIKIVDNISEKLITNPQDPIRIAPSMPITLSVKHEWIKCSDRLPNYDIDVLATNIECDRMWVASRWINCGLDYFTPTICTCCDNFNYKAHYWMPLPEMPND